MHSLQSKYIIHNLFAFRAATSFRMKKIYPTYSMQKQIMFHYETMLASLNEAWSASVDDFTPRKEVINESNHWLEKGEDGCFCSSWRKDVDIEQSMLSRRSASVTIKPYVLFSCSHLQFEEQVISKTCTPLAFSLFSSSIIHPHPFPNQPQSSHEGSIYLS